jgi:GT2 family glycosyltransferase
MVREKFPWVKLIENTENVGFSRGNNVAINQAVGEYVLLLNPDTVVQEDTFKCCLEFMDSHPDAGALGVKMIDGKGRFLPESKRALPTPMVAFYKIFGFSKFFPRSKRFGKYHLTYLDKNQNHQVEILCGAFMFMRSEALKKSGLLDEVFFMYGEDIDLSYRIIKAGYNNYYLADTTIIHYKGESTKKGSVNYVVIFYNAMLIFARKHFSARNAMLYTLLIQFAIYFRASLAIIRRFFIKIALPAGDVLLILLGFYALKEFWGSIKFGYQGAYPTEFLTLLVPVYALIWLFCLYITGAYERKQQMLQISKGILAGCVFNLIVYALLPLELRFSRLILLIGSFWAFLSILSWRFFLHKFKLLGVVLADFQRKRTLICGSRDETARIAQMLNQLPERPEVVGFVSPTPDNSSYFMGSMDRLDEMVRVNNIDEIIFCSGDLSSHAIVENMLRFTSVISEYKIAPPESQSIIGSNSIDINKGDFYLIDCNAISKESNRRYKRVLDVICAVLIFCTIPLWMFFIRKPFKAMLNILKVFVGTYSLVGYYPGTLKGLPQLKTGILWPTDGVRKKDLSDESIVRLNLMYARDYHPINDLGILVRGFAHIGR